MSLLTDEDIRKATFIPDEYGDPDFCVTLFGKDRDRAIADASQAKTLKAVAELVNSRLNCDDLMRLAELLTNPLAPASSVKVTVELTALELRMLELGKMPGEEKRC